MKTALDIIGKVPGELGKALRAGYTACMEAESDDQQMFYDTGLVPITDPTQKASLRQIIMNAFLAGRVSEHARTGQERYDGAPIMQQGHATAEKAIEKLVQTKDFSKIYPVAYDTNHGNYLALLLDGDTMTLIVTSKAPYPLPKSARKRLSILTYYDINSPNRKMLYRMLLDPKSINKEQYLAVQHGARSDHMQMLNADMANMKKKAVKEIDMIDEDAGRINEQVKTGSTDMVGLKKDVDRHKAMSADLSNLVRLYNLKSEQYGKLAKKCGVQEQVEAQ